MMVPTDESLPQSDYPLKRTSTLSLRPKFGTRAVFWVMQSPGELIQFPRTPGLAGAPPYGLSL